MAILIRATLIPFSLWTQLRLSGEYVDWDVCQSIIRRMGFGRAGIHLLNQFVAPLGFYPEDDNNPGSPLPGRYSIFPKMLMDDVLNDAEFIWINSSGAVFDVRSIKEKFDRLKRRSERENKRILTANGYEGSATSEVFARFNLIKKQVVEIRKLVERFNEVYGFLFPNANLYLTKTWANSGYSYQPYSNRPRNLRPGERRLPQAVFVITQTVPVGKLSVAFSQGKAYISSDAKKGKKKLALDKPAAVLTRLREFGLPVNAHDFARVIDTDNKSAHKRKIGSQRARRRGRVA
jgi:hypothetical protein